jgi:hypothetical protein
MWTVTLKTPGGSHVSRSVCASSAQQAHTLACLAWRAEGLSRQCGKWSSHVSRQQ